MSMTSDNTDAIPNLLDDLERMMSNRTPAPSTRAATAAQRGDDSGGDISGTLLAQVETVYSVENSPAFHSTAQNQLEDIPRQPALSNSTRKFRLFIMPDDPNELERICGGLIGQGATFCACLNCNKTHRSGKVITKTPNQVYVAAKAQTVAFLHPTINANHIPQEILESWEDSANTLDQWNSQFLVVSTLENKTSPTKSDFEDAELFASKALSFKTPAKRARDEAAATPAPIVISPYRAQISKDAPQIQNLETLERVIRGLDDGLGSTNRALRMLVEEYEQLIGKQSEDAAQLNFKTESMVAQVGLKPEEISEDFDAPNLWSAVAAIANSVETVRTQTKEFESIQVNVSYLQSTLQDYESKQTALEQEIKESKKQMLVTLKRRKDQDDQQLINALTRMANHIQQVRFDLNVANERISEIEGLDSPPLNYVDVDSLLGDGLAVPNKRRRHHTGQGALERIDQLEATVQAAQESNNNSELNKRVQRLEEAGNVNNRPKDTELMDRVHRLEIGADEKAVAFANLGFGTMMDATAWLEVNAPSADVSLILDAHMVFEHIYKTSSKASSDTLKYMENMAKIKTRTLGDTTAISSFDTRIPKLFASVDSMGVIKSDQSFFEHIKTYEQWSYPFTGVRDKIAYDLEEFTTTHAASDSKIFFVASQALTLSVAWIGAFLQFIDDYYKELSKAKLGSNKAWHVTTRIARRILADVSLPRVGARNHFSVTNPEHTSRQIFWSVVRAHDEMASFKAASFRNHPAVASELVKFLAVNTGFEIVERLQTQMTQVLTDVAAIQKSLASTAKTASTSANKAEEAKKEVDALKKRFDTFLKKNPSLSS